ncbi:hypothetical protein A1O3_08869 [Capronia epimyces CBS 606.96]|uniref:Uncharacterized protein n=1 Tax=Capronia epimyces CBS 606.96 TaxID=1182542 RepID=W9XFW3_9EURO|nr:uncharacterized protein A1O3_08869 [Capronia epimyces CBS 606.96]EXJ79367.1 hypothetical protein A1O3_08869 [Capronia epimyces CBS 606.96]
MSAEATPKKRGRPPKKAAASATAADNVIVIEAPVPKPRAKAASAKKSSSSVSSATRKAADLTKDNVVVDAVPAVQATSSTKARTAKGSSTSSSSSTSPAAETIEPSATKQPVVNLKSKSRKASTTGNVEEPAIASTLKKSKSVHATLATAAAAESPAVGRPDLRPSMSLSKILQQAKAFAKTSTEVHDAASQLVQDREAVHVSRRQELQQQKVAEESVSRRPPVEGIIATTTAPNESEITSAASEPLAKPHLATAAPTATASRLDGPFNSNPLPSVQMPPQPPPVVAAISGSSSSSSGKHRSPAVAVVTPKYVLPNSTVAALAARNVHSQRPSGSSSTHGPTLPPASSRRSQQGLGVGSANEPRRPRPTEIPLEQLKKDPQFRALSRRWTSLMVALPFAIVTSYFLWQRYEEHQAYLQSKEAKKILGSAKSEPAAPETAASTSTSASSATTPGSPRV